MTDITYYMTDISGDDSRFYCRDSFNMIFGDFDVWVCDTKKNVTFDDDTDIKEIDKFKNIYDIGENGVADCIWIELHYKINSHKCFHSHKCKYQIFMTIFYNPKNMFINWRECEEDIAIDINQPDFTFPQELKDRTIKLLKYIKFSAFS